jgi:hypothetical protein
MGRLSNSSAAEMAEVNRTHKNTGKLRKFYFVSVMEITNPSSIIARGWSESDLTGPFCTSESEGEFSPFSLAPRIRSGHVELEDP